MFTDGMKAETVYAMLNGAKQFKARVVSEDIGSAQLLFPSKFLYEHEQL